MASCTVVGFAKGEKKSDYPFIYVHGMCGWGDGAPQEENDRIGALSRKIMS